VDKNVRLADIKGIDVDEAMLKKHVLHRPELDAITSDRGLHEGDIQRRLQFFPPLIHKRLDVDGFSDALHAALAGEVAGYCAELRHHGLTVMKREWLWAQRPGDGQEAWQDTVRMHIASVSKLMTAMAMTQLLEAHGIGFDTPIVGFLPSYWAKGPNVDRITFRHLMTHTSGFVPNTSASDFFFMKGQVAAGVLATDLGQYHYENMNFGLCRLLLTVVDGVLPAGATFGILTDALWDIVTIAAYTGYLQANVFSPAGAGGSLVHDAATALAYAFPPTNPGFDSGNLAEMAGGAGWHMTVANVLDVMGAFRRNGTILSPNRAAHMLNNAFGIDLILDTPIGRLYNKNGFWLDGLTRTEQTLAYFLPDDMELVVFANSPVGPQNTFFRDLVTQIYLDNLV
jgi:CubicO group peptidase (beta-lactamase class C family)